MHCKSLLLLLALSTATPAGAEGLEPIGNDGLTPGRAESRASQTGGQSYGDRNRGGPRGFYSYPSHRHVDGRSRGLDRAQPAYDVGDPSHAYDSNYGSAYYGRNYGAPYHGGGYYDGGVYYRERRD